MSAVSIIGCGFVADLYMRSLATFPAVQVVAVFDRDAARCRAFCKFWNLKPSGSLTEFFASQPKGTLVLNLTNPGVHFEVNKTCLENGFHVYSEKPLAMSMDEAKALHILAADADLLLASAPCSVLGEAAQTLGHAIRSGVAGKPRLIYAELDDGFVPQAPFADWTSESGASWPWRDEFQVGCTLEHAGYYLTWLIAFFGSVTRVVASSTQVLGDKGDGGTTPDFSTATLFFEDGPVARLTCSIIAPHNHEIKVIGDAGVLRLKRAWHNTAAVRFHRRFTLRRRLMEHPLGKRLRLKGETHPKVGRRGAAAMNFALGPMELLSAIAENRQPRLTSEFALHLNEVTLAIQNSGNSTGAQVMETRCSPMEPMPWAM